MEGEEGDETEGVIKLQVAHTGNQQLKQAFGESLAWATLALASPALTHRS